ncbi:probable RNA methyltransferase CG11342 isoform X2 [Cryptotermes secundus]|uniref:probable RNA methyltransferase CG11342 isoform X2 n=1 Tax=Cryptotermes secundus TaxID=105785 RepID=UPI000CD7D146|nr:probable RNA methyltransferase CG11342 isoform X2 [Cryptotermes secundus]
MINLTQELYKFVSTNLSVTSSVERTGKGKGVADCHILGIDLDPVLIVRAEEANKFTSNVTYKCVNYMSDSENTISLYLKQQNRNYFDCIFCFSVTMWIHLNYGDEGLKQFLISVSVQTNLVVIEPQPWKCYRSAVRRMKRSGGNFPKFGNLKMRELVSDIENIFLNECNFIRIEKGNPSTDWGRQILFFKKVS